MEFCRKERKRPKFRLSFLFLFTIASFAVCFTLYMRDDSYIITGLSANSSEEPAVYANLSVDSAKRVINPVVRSEPRGKEYFDTALFIGNADLKGLAEYSLVPPDRVIAQNGLKFDNLDSFMTSYKGEVTTIPALVESISPEALYLLIGSQEAYEFSESVFTAHYQEFIDNIKEQNPGTAIYLISLFPIPADSETQERTNAKINSFNSAALSFANRNGIYYLDVNTELTGNDGKLPSSMSEDSEMSALTREAYEIIADYILSHVSE
ncbi:MAG: GDSL-type esterase/lipase family protein [Oscillospiraceae bacterium]|nr:GDSL-type esterase/lipase family protein [Oscillospiraceae bacterium]